MKKEVINGMVVLTADEGKVLQKVDDENIKGYSVWLGKSDESAYVEIDDEKE